MMMGPLPTAGPILAVVAPACPVRLEAQDTALSRR